MKLKLKKNEILVLRDVQSDMTSRGGFIYPESGYVEAPDWKPHDRCGNGLHGLPWGTGGEYFISGGNGKYLVLRVNTSKDYIYGSGEMVDKCKFKAGEVVYCGSLRGAVDLIQEYAPTNTPINYAMQYGEDKVTQTAGECSTQTAGECSTQTASDGSTQTACDYSTQKAGDWSNQTTGDKSTQTAGERSRQTAGDMSTQTGGIDTVQIIKYHDGNKWTVKTRIVTNKEANKPYKFYDGDWHLVED